MNVVLPLKVPGVSLGAAGSCWELKEAKLGGLDHHFLGEPGPIGSMGRLYIYLDENHKNQTFM